MLLKRQRTSFRLLPVPFALVWFLALPLMHSQALGAPDLGPSEKAAAWDFNGDGSADLAVGAPGEGVESGGVNVLYGSPAGPTTVDNQFWNKAKEGVLGTRARYERFGDGLASGDFDADGFADLAIAAPLEYNEPFSGAVHVLYGSGAGLSADRNQVWTEHDLTLPPGTTTFAEARRLALAAGDFDGDGRDDLAIGISGQYIDQESAGAVGVLYGSGSGLSADGNQFFSRETPGVRGSVRHEFDVFGWSLAAADFGHGSEDDLAVGAPGIGSPRGSVNLIYGSEIGLSPADDQLWTQDSPGVDEEGEQADEFGFALAAGDFDHAGRADLAIGVPGESVGGIERAGAVNVLYGRDRGLTSAHDQLWTRDSTGTVGQAGRDERYGLRLIAGDFGRSVDDDLAVGVLEGHDDETGSYAGAVHVLYGEDSSGLTSADDQLWRRRKLELAHGPGLDVFGDSLVAADYDADGREDLAIGAPFADVGQVEDAGGVYVVFGTDSGLAAERAQLWNQDVQDVANKAEANDLLGVVSAGIYD